MRLKSAVALLLLTQLLTHAEAHALLLAPAAPLTTELAAPTDEHGAQAAGPVLCPACVAHRALPAAPALLAGDAPFWQTLRLPPVTRVSLDSFLILPARAPPAA